MLLGEAPHSQLSRFAIEVECQRTDDFRKCPGGKSAQRFQLPEPVLRDDIALKKERIIDRSGTDVRNPETVPGDGRLHGYRSFDTARRLRKRPPGPPVCGCEECN